MILHIKLVKTKQMCIIKPPVVCLRECKCASVPGLRVKHVCSENSTFLTPPLHYTFWLKSPSQADFPSLLGSSTYSPAGNLSRDIFVWPKITNVFILLFFLFSWFVFRLSVLCCMHAWRRCQCACLGVLILWRVYTEDATTRQPREIKDGYYGLKNKIYI